VRPGIWDRKAQSLLADSASQTEKNLTVREQLDEKN